MSVPAGPGSRRAVFAGTEGAFSGMAAAEYFADVRSVEVEVVGCAGGTRGCVRAVASGAADYAVVPLEHAHCGTDAAVYDELLALPEEAGVTIVAEAACRDELCAVGLPGSDLRGAREVVSHPAILERCAGWIDASLGPPEHRKASKAEPTATAGVRRVASLDSASACREIAERGAVHAVAVASRAAAELYGLEVLAADVADSPSSETRYVVLGAPGASAPPRDGGAEAGPLRSTLCLALRNDPGSFYRALSCFALRGINVLKIESRPAARGGRMFSHREGELYAWEQLFFVDYQPHADNAVNQSVLRCLEEFCERVRVLGTYRQNLGELVPVAQRGPNNFEATWGFGY